MTLKNLLSIDMLDIFINIMPKIIRFYLREVIIFSYLYMQNSFFNVTVINFGYILIESEVSACFLNLSKVSKNAFTFD